MIFVDNLVVFAVTYWKLGYRTK